MERERKKKLKSGKIKPVFQVVFVQSWRAKGS
jgi:hypothetical protein